MYLEFLSYSLFWLYNRFTAHGTNLKTQSVQQQEKTLILEQKIGLFSVFACTKNKQYSVNRKTEYA